MKITPRVGDLFSSDADAVILSFFATNGQNPPGAVGDEKLDALLAGYFNTGDFKAKLGDTEWVYTQGTIPAKRVILLGLGKAEEFTPDQLRRAAARALQKCRQLKLKRVATTIPTLTMDTPPDTIDTLSEAFVEGARLGLYQYYGQKKDKGTDALETLEIFCGESHLAAAEEGIRNGAAIADGVMLARDLINLPPNYCTPDHLATTAQEIAHAHSLKVEILDRKQMEALKMGALLGVVQGTDTPPKFIILEYNAAKAAELPTLVLVGKGVTFDTGGYSLKTKEGMVGMKEDMSGGAGVLGALKALAQMSVPLHVVGLVPAADNMINGSAYRPNDVFTASNGVTIEIVSTDAEGRMLLADALVYAQRYQPAAVVDIATLTGAISIALGPACAGMFTNDEALRDRLIAAGKATAEPVWHMPIFPEHKKMLESETADTKNNGAPPGGACSAAAFLQLFVDYPWAHLDIAGVMGAGKDNPYAPTTPTKSTSAFGTRLLIEFVRRWSAEKPAG